MRRVLFFFFRVPWVLAFLLIPRLIPNGLWASGPYGVRSPLFSSFVAIIESIAFADWVRRTPRMSAAVRPRRRTPPSRAPDRCRRGAVEQPDSQPAPVRRQPGPSSAVPGYREKSVGKTVGKPSAPGTVRAGGDAFALEPTRPAVQIGRPAARTPWPVGYVPGTHAAAGELTAAGTHPDHADAVTTANLTALELRLVRGRPAPRSPALDQSRAAEHLFGRSVRNLPEVARAVRQVPVQIEGYNVGIKLYGLSASLLL